MISYDPKYSRPSDISSDILNDYYSLFKTINVKQISIYDQSRVRFPVWSTGNVSGGDKKGYVYKPDERWLELFKERDNLDDFSSFNEEFFYRRKIKDDWYIYYEHWL